MEQIIFILGAPRCGKTTLTKKIIELTNSSYIILSLDAFSSMLRREFDDFNLYTEKVIIQPNVNVEKFINIIKGYVKAFVDDYPNQTIIIEGCQITPKQATAFFPNSKIICLGRTGDIVDIKNAIITKDWMAKLPQSEIEEYARKIHQLSVNYKNECKKTNYLYCETGQDVMSDVMEYLS